MYKEVAKLGVEGFNNLINTQSYAAIQYIKMINFSYKKIKGTINEQQYWHSKRIELSPNIGSYYVL